MEELGEAGEAMPLAPLGDDIPPSSSDAGLLWEPGLSFPRTFLRDMAAGVAGSSQRARLHSWAVRGIDRDVLRNALQVYRWSASGGQEVKETR